MSNQNRKFEGVWIEKEVWVSKSLTLQEKCFFVEIKSLDNKDGCFATNEYFSDFFQISKRRCISVINSLDEKGLINKKLIYKKGTKQVEKRVLRVSNTWRKKLHHPSEESFTTPHEENDMTPVKEVSPPSCQNVHDPGEGMFTDNSTVNNTSNSIINSTEVDFASKDAPQPIKKETKRKPVKQKKITQRKKVAAKKESRNLPAKEPSLHTKAKERFNHWYEVFDKDAPPIYWDGKEVGQLTQMLNRLQDAAKKKNFTWSNDDQFLEQIFDVFCKRFIESNHWFSDSFVPSNIVSKWNIIIQTLHDNGKRKTNQRGQNTGVTEGYKARIYATLAGR